MRINEVVDVAVEVSVMKGVGMKHGDAGRSATCVDFVEYAGCCVSGVDECKRFDEIAGCCEARVQLVRAAGCCEASDQTGWNVEWL